MPFKSEAQKKKMYALAAEGKISPATLKEWEDATKGSRLPDHTTQKAKKTKIRKARVVR